MRIIVTGGAGFIGSHLVRMLVEEHGHEVFVVDKLSYASDLANLEDVNSRIQFAKIDINERTRLAAIFQQFKPQAIFNLAAESHVDRSIELGDAFVQSNFNGTFQLLEATREYLAESTTDIANEFRFVHVSTDEVFGSAEQGSFTEKSTYYPSSPYSASKAAADQMVHAWHVTYGLPTIVTRSSNNYGPFQHPEKLIPKTITNAIAGKPIPIYGAGNNVRDWLHVADHVQALYMILLRGSIGDGFNGESFNIASSRELTNVQVVQSICQTLDRLHPDAAPHRQLIEFVSDRPGHDFRYSMDCSKIKKSICWQPEIEFEAGIQRTVKWYLEKESWWKPKIETPSPPAPLPQKGRGEPG